MESAVSAINDPKEVFNASRYSDVAVQFMELKNTKSLWCGEFPGRRFAALLIKLLVSAKRRKSDCINILLYHRSGNQ